ncbi:MAG: translation elongation factor Ts [Candidatus Portnoybacteria bacterium]|nr:translation elongation factor Ts [Candidatus Portnoybacteria bacterium]
MDLSLLKKLRDETGASIMACKKALDEAKGDVKKAREYIKVSAQAMVEKRSGREVREGVVASYIHNTNRVGSLVQLNCETDFVAHTPEFQRLAKELALHIAGMNPKDIKELLAQPYVRDPSIPVKDVIAQTVGSIGEHIEVVGFTRYEI